MPRDGHTAHDSQRNDWHERDHRKKKGGGYHGKEAQSSEEEDEEGRKEASSIKRRPARAVSFMMIDARE
ncbi:hypothetical protein HY480_01755 [Candidatus Uhrbacteria bacterium]|nr:hypothetical protein [Candidatus Uhrbacteria bacterium]